MKLTQQDGKDVVYQCHEDWETVEEKTVDTTRWSVIQEGVFKHIPTGKHYKMSWRVGATEMQDERPFDYEEPELVEVISKPVTVMTWVPVEN